MRETEEFDEEATAGRTSKTITARPSRSARKSQPITWGQRALPPSAATCTGPHGRAGSPTFPEARCVLVASSRSSNTSNLRRVEAVHGVGDVVEVVLDREVPGSEAAHLVRDGRLADFF